MDGTDLDVRASNRVDPVPFFLPSESGVRFCIYHPPRGNVSQPRAVVYVHPFAEEMNKSRRMASLQSHRLAAAGIGVLQIDLLGCGDSSGDFADARWRVWKQDVKRAIQWLKDRQGDSVALWGLRLGAMLAADVASEPGSGVDHVVLWQPVINGDQFLTQFLRIRLASEMLTGGAAQSGVKSLRDALSRGEVLEVGGYALHPELAAEIGERKLAVLLPRARRVDLIEVSAYPDAGIGMPGTRLIEAWQRCGCNVVAAAVSGESFWSTSEISECPALLERTDHVFAFS